LAAFGCWLCFAAALLCKESALIFPALLLVVTLLQPQAASSATPTQSVFQRWIPLVGAIFIVSVYGLLRSGPLNFTKNVVATSSTGLGQRLIEAGQALATYFQLIVVPTNLHMERSLDRVPVWIAIIGYALLVVLVGLIVYAFRAGHRRAA